MTGGEYVFIAIATGLVTGFIGRTRGSSFFIWFVLGASLSVVFPPAGPLVAIVCALLYRREQAEPERRCPRCGKVLKLYVQVCPKCGEDLYLPDSSDVRQPAQR